MSGVLSDFADALTAIREETVRKVRAAGTGWSIAQLIAAIVLTIAIPLNLMVLVVIWQLTESVRSNQRAGLQYAARAVTGALDAELGKYVAFIQALSRSPALLEHDLAAFETEARRNFSEVEDAWVIVADLDGRQLVNTAFAPGSVLGVRTSEAIEFQRRAVLRRAMVLSDIHVLPLTATRVATIEVPIFKDGKPFRVLAVAMTMRPFLRLLGAQQIPPSWVVGIIDGEGRYVARVPGEEAIVGQFASDGWRATRHQEGEFEFTSREGDPLINFNAKPKLGEWTVGVAIKRAELEATALRMTRWAMILGGLLSLVSLGLATLLARRITAPLAELRRSASPATEAFRSLLSPADPPEIADLRSALVQAAQKRLENETRQELLLTVTSLLIDAHERKDLGRMTFEIVGPPHLADVCLKYRYDKRTGKLVLAYHHGLPTDVLDSSSTLDVGQAFCGKVAQTLKPLIADATRIAADPAAVFERNLGIRAYCCHPLRARDGRVLGTFSIASTRRERFEDDEVALFATAANVLAQAVERFEAEAALKQAHDTFRHLVEQSPFGIYTVDADFRLAQVSCGAQRVFANVRPLIGRDFEEVLREIWPEPFVSDAVARFRETLSSGEPYHASKTIERRKDLGEIEAYDWKIERIMLPDGRLGVVCHFYDLSERQRHEAALQAAHDRQAVLMRELAHRGKNLAAVVQAIAARSFTSQRAVAESLPIFYGRLQALANTFATFTETAAETSSLHELAATQLKMFADRVEIQGPVVLVPAKAAQILALVIHELSTNSAKYGAWSVPAGRVRLIWRILPGKDAPRLEFTWIECGGPPAIPPERHGFGTILLTKIAGAEFGCEPTLHYGNEGLQYTFEAELARVGHAPGPGPEGKSA